MEIRNLRLLIDVGVGKKVERWLHSRRYDIKCVRDIDARMPDKEILKIAVSDKRIVITMDKDFGELVYNSGLPHGGVLLLRLEDAKADEKIKVLERILEKYPDKLSDRFCVFKDGKLRSRK
ncbi:MAG: DUF5615 family PIN-like protein [Planctomycetes bacterium]|nr:DUF5615 family PIN-like protein [Planctomycetota bacterium]